jgi:hypothetical protein
MYAMVPRELPGLVSPACVAPGQLNTQIKHQAHVDGRAGDAMFQRLPLERIHADKRLILSLADIVDGTNTRVIQSGCGAGFALKAV